MSFPIATTCGQDTPRSNGDVFYKVDKAVGGVYAAGVESKLTFVSVGERELGRGGGRERQWTR